MADSKISGLTADATPDGTDIVYATDAAGATDKKVALVDMPVSTLQQAAADAAQAAAEATAAADATAKVAAEAVLARNADNLTSGTVADARIASTIARDSEVTAAVAAEATIARNADNLTSGTVADARIASTIARDSEVAAGYQPLDSDLTSIAALAPANDDLVQRKAGAWTNRTPAQVKTDLALAKGDVGLGNVDNTSDANKPVSTATQTALNLKTNAANAVFTGSVTIPDGALAIADTSGLQTALDAKQPLDADLTALAAAGNSGVLAATTAAFLAADRTKVDGIEALADVTDATNVAAAGAVMDTGNETIAGVKTFSSSPVVPAPTTATQAAQRATVDDEIAALRQLVDSDDGRITIDDATSGQLKPVLTSAAQLTSSMGAAWLVTRSNTTAENSGLGALFAAPFGSLVGINSVVEIVISGALTNNTGVARSLTVRVDLGAVTLFEIPFTDVAASATNRRWVASMACQVVDLSGLRLLGTAAVSLSDPAGGAAVGSVVVGAIDVVDFTDDWNVTLQMSAASANLTCSLASAVYKQADV